MKNFIIILAVLFAVSCTPKKMLHKTKSEQKTELKNDIADKKDIETKTDKKIDQQSNDSTQVVEKKIVYDTTKPIDQATGRPPVKEETTITKTKIGKRSIIADITTVKKDNSTHTDQSKIDTTVKTEEKIAEEPKPPAVKYYFYILLTVVLVALSIIIYKKFGWIKSFFG